MSYIDTLIDRSKTHTNPQPTLPEALPNVKAAIICCADMRVDPAILLGLHTGEAVVLRNIGGRVTPFTLQELGLLGRIGEVAQKVPGGGGEFHLIVLQHTDCGITRLANDHDKLAAYFQVPESEVAAKTVLDPQAAVKTDVAALRAVCALPDGWLVSGLVYHVDSGRFEIVVPPAPIR